MQTSATLFASRTASMQFCMQLSWLKQSKIRKTSMPFLAARWQNFLTTLSG